jgi:hypothetical protein
LLVSFRVWSVLEELEVELDGVLLVSELDCVALVEPLAEPVVEPLAEPLALMSVLEDEEREVSVLEGVVLDGVEVDRSELMSELLRVDLLQPATPNPNASAARVAAPVSFIFCVFIMSPPRFLIV